MKYQNIEISRIKVTEITEYSKLAGKTFYETFRQTTSGENMRKYLEDSFSKNRLKSELLTFGAHHYFARVEGEIAGYLNVNTGGAQNVFKGDNFTELERLYVLKEFQGTGTGQALLNKAFEIAIGEGTDHIWLGVWENNFRAIRFYIKNGFVHTGEHLFMVGDDRQTDLLMERKL